MTSNIPHSTYPHLYVVVRVDAGMSPENCFSLVSAWRSQEEAAAEVDRLSELAHAQSTYRVVVTRLKGTLWIKRGVLLVVALAAACFLNVGQEAVADISPTVVASDDYQHAPATI
jgi:hypothetical protein